MRFLIAIGAMVAVAFVGNGLGAVPCYTAPRYALPRAVPLDARPHARLRAQQQAPQQTPLQRLQASIERTTRSVNATWGI